MLFDTILEHNETAYGQNLRGFDAFMPNAFGSDPAQMEQYFNRIYIYGPDPRFPISPAMIAGAAAFKAVRSHDAHIKTPYYRFHHSETIDSIRSTAAKEAHLLLQQFPLPPEIDPRTVILSAEAGAHRLFDHEHY
ncbi:9718_t:CDS:2 [Ambispora leptoticha]|uniref:9718_t:CDS:1 n=1 Tax=Ambispora leptoticha TaxID=144679 RepID=A0A9N9ATK4_9GLOM|nr:9718_t:CDS:2 [Ambispora leptoticha]